MYQNYSSAAPNAKNNFLWTGPPGNVFIDSSTPVPVPSDATGMFFIIGGAGGTGGTGPQGNLSGNFSGGSGGGAGAATSRMVPLFLLPKVLYIVTISGSNQIFLSLTPDPGTVVQMALAAAESGANGLDGNTLNRLGGAGGSFVNGTYNAGLRSIQTGVGAAGSGSTTGAAGTGYSYSATQPFSSGGASGGGVSGVSGFVGGGASASATERTYINLQAGGAESSAISATPGQFFSGFNRPLIGTSGSGGGGAGSSDMTAGVSMLGSGGAGGGARFFATGGLSSLGGGPFVFIQFW